AILNANPNDVAVVFGRDLELISHGGSIGDAQKRMVVTPTGSVNARAQGDIYLETRDGDLRSDTIESLSGSIDLLSRGGEINIEKLLLSSPVEPIMQRLQSLAPAG